ncbi:MAG: beta-propeller domain-containing protein, partial [archaeon]
QTTTFEKQMIMPRDSTPENKTQYTFTTIKYDSSKDSVIDSLDILLDYSNTIYMSNNNLYITSKKQTYFTPWFFYRGGNNSNLDVFKEIYKDIYPSSVQRDIESNIDDAEKLAVILNDYYNSLDEDDKEKLYNKIQEETDNYYANIRQENEKTIINRIELNSNGKFGDITTGEVQGNLLNQFSMDEDADGYLRLAVTKTDKEYKNVNAIVILDIQLQEYSKLDDLAKDERIYSVRFMGDKVFLVTFKQIDPFFVIDLSDKRNPEVLGYLKIPGYSSYLHPISDTLILGIGQDTKVSQWGGTVNSGVKVTLFDVSDYSDPEEVATYKITSENSYTPVQNDHKAFMYMESEKLIVLPVTENFNTRGPETNFYVLKVTDSDIVKTEIISHSGQSYGNILRSLYIGKEIYTISDNQIKTYNVDTEEMVSKGI